MNLNNIKFGEVIKDASYYVIDTNPKIDSPIYDIPGAISGNCKYITFYTFDGNPIITIPFEIKNMFDIQEMIDVSAPIPKPYSFRKIWWPAIQVGFGLTKGSPGYAVMFHDKNGNRIGWERIKDENVNIKENHLSKFNLKDVIEEKSDFTLKETNYNNNGLKSNCLIM